LLAAVVETRREPGYEWVKFYTGDEDGSYVLVKESLITRVEIGYRPVVAGERLPIGFRVAESAAD
jgi:hypothetical protein